MLSSSATSTALHLVFIYLAVMATSRVAENIIASEQDTISVLIAPVFDEASEPEPSARMEVLNLQAPPKGFQTLAAPTNVPTEIPPIDLTRRFDARDFSGIGTEGGVFTGIVGGTGPVDLTQTFLEAVVDEPPKRLSGPPLRYPEVLRSAGIEGQVQLEFVIDADGRVDESSLKVVSSTDRAFEGPAGSAVLRSVYRPGYVQGQAVRVLVTMTVVFQIIT